MDYDLGNNLVDNLTDYIRSYCINENLDYSVDSLNNDKKICR